MNKKRAATSTAGLMLVRSLWRWINSEPPWDKRLILVGPSSETVTGWTKVLNLAQLLFWHYWTIWEG